MVHSKEFSTPGYRNGACDRYELSFHTIENDEKPFKYAGKVRLDRLKMFLLLH